MKYLFLSISITTAFFSGVHAQPGISGFELEKPAKYENRKLASEKTGETKFSLPKRFIQNNITHYNYYYNANARLREIIERAKAGFRDDYTKLLPFYNYSLENTAQYKQDLDSIIYKATAGILLHDLRNSFIDNLYLLIGQSYYFRNQLDSAYLTFQYLNYAFSPKEKDGWDKVIGSNANEGGNVFSVATPENNHIFNRVVSRPPSRNESFIWQIRTLLADDRFDQAAGLIETFRQDPLFPDRLNTDLKEVQAWYFYKQHMYDSAAFYLTQALDNAVTPLEQARWEYLIAQLHDRSGNHELAKTFFKKASLHTLDPLLEVHAILNTLRQDGTGNEAAVKQAVEGLLKMARKDKYRLYRDIIYYTAANIEEEHQHPEAAEKWLLKSIEHSVDNPSQKNSSYLALGDIAFSQKRYSAAKDYYDSVNTTLLSPDSMQSFTSRKTDVDNIVLPTGIIERQDSLLRIAALPEEEREAFVKDLAKKLRKNGKRNKEESNTGSLHEGVAQKTADLFDRPGAKSEGYFNNASLKTKGYAEFKATWGDRPNADNWRRSASVSRQFAVNELSNEATDLPAAGSDLPADNSYEGLMARLPLTEPARKITLDSTEHALFALGKAYQNGLEEYLPAIAAYERLLSAFPASTHAEEAWFNLYYCYGKTGNTAGQQQAKEVLTSRFGDGNYTLKLHSTDQGISPDSLYRKEASDAYSEIYDLFIQGKFAEAIAKKTAADGRFGQNHWTPQLLYIEAIYHIRERNDSLAKTLLDKIISLDPSGPLGEKSKAILDVLSRRKEIETYLTNLEIKRPDEAEQRGAITDNSDLPQTNIPDKRPEPAVKDTVAAPSAVIPKNIDRDSAKDTVRDSANNVVRDSAKDVARDIVKDVARDIVKDPTKDIAKDIANDSSKDVTRGIIKDAVSDSTKDVAKDIVKDTLAAAATPAPGDSLAKIAKARALSDTLAAKKEVITRDISKKDSAVNRQPSIFYDYPNTPASAHYVALVLTQVDPVYVTEARNAFNRYNRENYYNKPIESSPLSLTDSVKLVLFQPFENAAAAYDYIQKARALTEKQIIPWLKADKYSFILISPGNLELLKNRKDMNVYRAFLKAAFPGKDF